MIDLKKSYHETRNQALKLMQQGRLSAYIAQLAELQAIRLQILNYARTAK